MKTSYFLGEGKKSRMFLIFEQKLKSRYKISKKSYLQDILTNKGIKKKVFIYEKMAKTLP